MVQREKETFRVAGIGGWAFLGRESKVQVEAERDAAAAVDAARVGLG
jgi:hypothetical protein